MQFLAALESSKRELTEMPYLYVQNVNDEFKYTGSNDAMDYRSKVAYLILWPRNN